ncbi:MAG TPA: diaminopimelate epimerase [Microthrixaceae bacterium]|nr:diaminopimelate epimerase [Microthrixaceae bacterium]
MLRLTKHHGLGNDFLVALESLNPGLVPDPDLARSICDRRLGIGADGLLLSLEPAESTDDSCMVLLNADGSEAEISGNGIRCLAQALLRNEGLSEGDLRIETPGGVRHLRSVRGDADGEIWFQVDMGIMTDGPEPGPATRRYPALRYATRGIGNPHLVLLVDDSETVNIGIDGPSLESDYTEGMNVHFVDVLSDDEIRLRVWERGAGLTEACGSGATVAAAVAHEWGLVGDHVRVSMPGGTATVDISERGLMLTGPAVFVGEVVYPWPRTI